MGEPAAGVGGELLMANYITTDTDITSIANAIRAKGRTSAQLEYPSDFVAAIEAIDTKVKENDVTYYDYDGSVVDSYTLAEFAELNEHPANPTHTGLTAQGWNWTLSDAQDYAAAHGRMTIGQMYATSDGKTRLYIELKSDERLDMPLNWIQTESEGVTVDWGDESTPETEEGTGEVNKVHTYAAAGSYVITMDVTDGSMELGGNNTAGTGKISVHENKNNNIYIYQHSLVKAEIGSNTIPMANCFRYSHRLQTITIPYGVESIYNNTFYDCPVLKTVTIPNSVTTIGNYIFSDNHSLETVNIPNSVTSYGNGIFNYCMQLKHINFQDGIQPKDDMFNGCYCIDNIEIPDGTTSIGTYAFSNSCITTVDIPDDVTSIGNNAFYRCEDLTKLTIPDGVTAIGTYAFYLCRALKELHIEATSPPTITNSTTFAGIPDDITIYVPEGYLTAYQQAANWSDYASKMVEE